MTLSALDACKTSKVFMDPQMLGKVKMERNPWLEDSPTVKFCSDELDKLGILESP